MGKTVLDLTPEELRKYSLRPKRRPNLAQRKKLMARAMRQARRTAKLLKRDFGATRVVLFGSLAHRLWFTRWSDIDLAVWGIPSGSFFDVAGSAIDSSKDFRIQVVNPVNCKPSVHQAIQEEGIDL